MYLEVGRRLVDVRVRSWAMRCACEGRTKHRLPFARSSSKESAGCPSCRLRVIGPACTACLLAEAVQRKSIFSAHNPSFVNFVHI
mmetsp:Transcript_12732/g.38907  ORF Transcript_12732/g.38907 Transcript_12732/m.38907 type:complete len:85 (-) Transcript_12732:27-281(-)|eukprot:scaffold233885_cov28-Tisochrysis_lutea.AAC.1